MKTRYSILIICLLALFATGCKKDNNRIRIFAQNMTNDSKILIDPSDVNNASWVAGESILLYIWDGEDEISGSYTIGESNQDGFYIEVDQTGEVVSAFYPAGSFGGNDIEISDAGIVLRRLTINFHSGNNTPHDVVFPMMANPDASSSSSLLFDHITAGLKLTLAASDPVNVASIKIVAKNSSPMENMDPGICSWAVLDPIVPFGDIGILGDQEVLCYNEMNFDFTTDGNPGATITYNGLSFCIPVTIHYLNGLTVIGYSANGEVLFHVTKGFSQTSLSVNTMYTLPTIIIGSDSDVGSNDEMD